MNATSFQKLEKHYHCRKESEDYYLNDLIGKRNQLVENRVQLLCNSNYKIEGGETKVIYSHLLMQKSLKNRSILVKKNDQITNLYISEGLISHQFRGRLSIQVTNTTTNPVEIPHNFLIGYLIISPLINV